MKKIITLVSILIGLTLFASTAYADSPLTSTNFNTAYQDINIVKAASESGIVNDKIASFLANPKNPIDIKAAVINALSWDIDGKNNAQTYSTLIYNKKIEALDKNSLSGDQLFCIGYLLAMDDYFHVEDALEFMTLAEAKITDSFTVSMIKALVKSMDLKKDEWEANIQPILQSSTIHKDMRQEAVNIILDYMANYSNTKLLHTSQSNVLVCNEENVYLYLYGTNLYQDAVPYQITHSSANASVAICKDKYGVFYLKITGLVNGTSSITIKSNENKSVTIPIEVISKIAYSRMKNTVSMYVGSGKTYIGTEKSSLNIRQKPYIRKENKYIPLEYAISAIGGRVQYEKKTKGFTITLNGKTILLQAGNKTATMKKRKINLCNYIELKNNYYFITVQDFAALTGTQYIYRNGFIILMKKSNDFDLAKDLNVLDDISELVQSGQNIMDDPVSMGENGLYGYMDYATEKTVIKPIYRTAYDFREGVAAVVILDFEGKEKYGFIDRSGTYLVEPIYDWAGDFCGGLAPVTLDGKTGFINKEGKVVIAFQFKNAQSFKEGLAAVQNPEGTKWGFINSEGTLVIPYSYADCSSFLSGYAAVKLEDKWGYIDISGAMVIPPIYEEAYPFCYGLARVKLEGIWYDINLSQQYVIFLDNGDCYVGKIKDGLFEGEGVYTWADGSQYSGSFSKGKFHGKAIYTGSKGDTMQGYWVNDAYTGETGL